MSKKTTEIIIDSQNNYLIGVKRNQPTLHGQIEAIIADKNNLSSSLITLEHNRGRQELRCIMVSNCIEGISADWKGLQQVIGVHRVVTKKGKQSEEMAYFISSINSNAFLYEEGIRSHWAIENSLHYTKDVTFKEDASKIRMGDAPQNISIIKNITLNIFNKNKFKNMAQATRLVANEIKVLYNLIA